MYYCFDAGYPLAWAYFVSLVLLGSFLVVNLFVGVLCAQFSEASNKAEKHG